MTHIFVARADGSERYQLTRGEKSATAPKFSPDGRWVFFLSEREGKAAVFRIALDGGEAERVTDPKVPAAAFEVSPNGKWIAYTGREADTAEERAQTREARFPRDRRIAQERPAVAGVV